ncbi:hypothetical protein [Alkalicoccobacillus plakortidis]|uniref:Uncharacterized protein n=1 Tax=Alkalicoccobacillus plakortidis TaxID=444060 RepID=A0ABT0XI53_9BACI|nr:hypothetical protein [Alkalicoccobacillus plakortidis]MCM2675590.1 hypothetical protein [Alkalicoccobacillus plakortidis]
MTKTYRAGLYISSFFPLYLLLILDNFQIFISWSSFKDILKFNNLAESLFWSSIFFLIVISIFSVLIIIKRKPNIKEKFSEITGTEDNLLSYVVTYLVPLLSIDINSPNSLLVNAGLFFLLGFIYVKNNLVYLNPLFLFFGYNIYKCETGRTIISNLSLYELRKNKDKEIWCRELGDNLFIVKKEQNTRKQKTV